MTDLTETRALGEVLRIKATRLDMPEIQVLCDGSFSEIKDQIFQTVCTANADNETTAYYRIDVTLPTSAGNEYQGALLSADFNWYAESPDPSAHTCESRCRICGKCRDLECTSLVCAEMYPGHGSPLIPRFPKKYLIWPWMIVPTLSLLPMLILIIIYIKKRRRMTMKTSKFAWFSASQTTSVQPIRFADYTVDVDISADEASVAKIRDIYTLQAGQTYTVILTAKGTATTGYCIIYLGAEVIHTVPISVNESKTFPLIIHENVDVKIVPQWGTSSQTDPWDGQTPCTYGEVAEAGTPSAPESEVSDDADAATPSIETEASDGTDAATPPTEFEQSGEVSPEAPSEVASESSSEMVAESTDTQQDKQTTE